MKRVIVLCLFVFFCSGFSCKTRTDTKIPQPPAATAPTKSPAASPAIAASPTPFIICGMVPGTTTLLQSCGPDPNNQPLPCQRPDGTFFVAAGNSIQFGILDADGIHCSVMPAAPIIAVPADAPTKQSS